MVGIKVHWLILQYVLGLPLLAVVAEALSAEAVNTLANLPGVYVVTGALLAPLLAAVAVLFYVMLTGEGEEAVQPTGGSGEQIPAPHRADVETNSTE